MVIPTTAPSSRKVTSSTFAMILMPLPGARKIPSTSTKLGRVVKTLRPTSGPTQILSMPPWRSLPNDDAEWFERNDLGMACWNATTGHQRGFEAFDMWCRKSPTKYDEVKVRGRWQHYSASPPSAIGAGTIFARADEAQFGWRALVGLPIDKVNEILKLSRLSMVAYDAERKEAAIRLGIRRSTLDEIVGRLCSRMTLNDDDENKQGTRFEFTTFEPWPDVVDGATLIADMMAAIRSHVILATHQSLAVALWIIHAHAVEVSDHSPRLQIRSPTIQCGKSTLIDTVAAMVPKVAQRRTSAHLRCFASSRCTLQHCSSMKLTTFSRTRTGATTETLLAS